MNEKKNQNAGINHVFFLFFGVSSDEAIPVSEAKMATNEYICSINSCFAIHQGLKKAL